MRQKWKMVTLPRPAARSARTAPLLPIASLCSQDGYRRLDMIFMAVLAATSLYSGLDGSIRGDLYLFMFGIGFCAVAQATVLKIDLKAV